ncbi:hypothetical protein [Capnocytophaga gingivalis]
MRDLFMLSSDYDPSYKGYYGYK